MFELTCKGCDNKFEGRTSWIEYCSPKCRKHYGPIPISRNSKKFSDNEFKKRNNVENRGFRPRQRGVPCSVKDCDNTCVSNDLCSKHNMQKRREADPKYAEYTKAYNLKHNKHPDINKVCPNCGKLYITVRKKQYYCFTCSKDIGVYEAQKRYRAKNINKVRERDSLGRRTRRRFTPETCCIDGCDNKGEAHHPDYERPYEVVWLCRTHHGNVHLGEIKFLDKDIRCDIQWETTCLMNAELFKHKAELITGGNKS